MKLINKTNLNQTNNRLLSATRPRENVLKSKNQGTMLQTRLKQELLCWINQK